MGRWTQYDEDDYRLPEGMERIGYDADTMRYYFRDRDGSVWQSAEGSEFGEMTRADRLPSSVAPHHHRQHHHQRRRPPPTTYQPLSIEPSRPMADRSTRSYRTPLPFSLLPLSSFSFTGIWSSRRDSQFLQKNVQKAHHLTEPSLATVSTEKHRERKDDSDHDRRSKISKKSIQKSIVTLSRRVSARLPFFRVKSPRPDKISRKSFGSAGKTQAINSRLASDDTQKLGSKFRRMEELLKDSDYCELSKILFYLKLDWMQPVVPV